MMRSGSSGSSWRGAVNIPRSLGLDVGDVRVGVALGDPLGILASPFTIVTRRGNEADYDNLLKIIADNAVELIVVGLPISMDGTEGPQALKTRAFAEELRRRTEVPLVYQDERLSTVEARRMVQEARKTTRLERYDAAAAALILQDYLNAANPAAFPDEAADPGQS
jgi:putative Holliday junction resolvase